MITYFSLGKLHGCVIKVISPMNPFSHNRYEGVKNKTKQKGMYIIYRYPVHIWHRHCEYNLKQEMDEFTQTKTNFMHGLLCTLS